MINMVDIKMQLDSNINYIVSGLERSGTSMIMQILEAGDAPVAYDNFRLPDKYNPNGYYELENGKIISRIIKGTFLLHNYLGRFIKITAYGLKFLPKGKYKIIYLQRDIDEVLSSMEKMMGKQDEEKEHTKTSFI